MPKTKTTPRKGGRGSGGEWKESNKNSKSGKRKR